MWSSLVAKWRRGAAAAAGLMALLLVWAFLLAPSLAAEPGAASPEKAAPAAVPEAGAKEDASKDTSGEATAEAPAGKPMTVYYLGKQYPEPLPLSYAEKPIEDKGIQGARLMLKEANQAGNFVGHDFERLLNAHGI